MKYCQIRVDSDLVRAKNGHRRGAAAIFAIFLCVAITVVIAVFSEFAYINTARTELTRTADSSALAAAWALHDARSTGEHNIEELVTNTAIQYGSANSVGTISPEVGRFAGDIEFGNYDMDALAFVPNDDPANATAVRVQVDLTASNHGELPLQLAGLTGRNTQSLHQTAVAAFLRNLDGFERPDNEEETVEILPIALDRETWDAVVADQTGDNLRYLNGAVVSGSDGFHECSLYPTGTGSPGNRGTVDIGSANNSTRDLSRQILDGISADDFDDLGKPLQFNVHGELSLNGDPGISAGIKDELADIIGQKRIIPIFESVQGNGNNANYTIVAFEGVRILAVKLTGPMRKKHLTIQPAPMIARHCRVATSGETSSEYLYAPAMLME